MTGKAWNGLVLTGFICFRGGYYSRLKVVGESNDAVFIVGVTSSYADNNLIDSNFS